MILTLSLLMFKLLRYICKFTDNKISFQYHVLTVTESLAHFCEAIIRSQSKLAHLTDFPSSYLLSYNVLQNNSIDCVSFPILGLCVCLYVCFRAQGLVVTVGIVSRKPVV